MLKLFKSLKIVRPITRKSRLCFSNLKPQKNRYEEIEKTSEDFFNAEDDEIEPDFAINSKKTCLFDEEFTIPEKIFLKFEVEKDPQISSLDLQNFVMKCSEKLNDKALRHFLSGLDIFKTKTNLNSLKIKKNVQETIFLSKSKKLFDQENASELLPLLLKCDVSRLTYENFSSTLFNFEEEIDLKNKITKFADFNNSQIPREKPLISDLENKHRKMSETDSSLLERISKLSTDQSYQNMSRLKDKNSNFVNDLDEISPKNLNFSINSTENSIFEMLNQEIEKSLNPNNESEIKNDETLRDEARDFHLKNYWQNTNIAKITRILQDTFREQSDLKLQKPNEILILKQKNFEKRQIPISNWVYVSRLPYQIDDIKKWEDLLTENFEKFAGKIKNIMIFQYKDFLNFNTKPKPKVILKENLDEIFIDLKNPVTNKERRNLKKQDEATVSPVSTVDEIIKQLKMDISDDEPETNKSLNERNMKKTDKILKNLSEKSAGKRLDRSYAFIEFETYQSKLKALTPDLRVFGIKLEKCNLLIDDADYKLTLMCNNVHWGASLEKFTNQINLEFEQKNVLDLQIEIDPKDSKKIVTKYFLLIRFNSLQNSLRAMHALKGCIYESRVLKTNHLFGSLKKFKDNYSEIIDGDINNDIFEKIKEKKIFELFNIHNSKIEEPEENVFKPEINDLLLEEGVKKIIEKDEENNNFPPFYMHNLDDEN